MRVLENYVLGAWHAPQGKTADLFDPTTGGVPEAVGEGLLIRCPDDPDEADLTAVRALLSDPGAGARARAWARLHHGPEACLSALDAALPIREAR